MKNYATFSINSLLFLFSLAFVLGCSSQKDNATNRSLQNLSARYNYIYNSNVLLDDYQNQLSQTHKDNYEELLDVYIAPVSIDYLNSSTNNKPATSLDQINKKAQAIISEKNLSNYIDEAYILLGKTNFYTGSYFTATEYFDYTGRTYKKDKKIQLNALNWKARSLMQLSNYADAAKVLDTVYFLLDSVKSGKAEPLATLAQMSIHTENYKKAISFLESAIRETNHIQSRTRWPYILGQLYELDKNYDASIRNYTKVENSNAPFEMYFNAKLSKIRINDLLKDQTSNRKQQLLRLLRDDKNIDYTDQIYYEVAEDYLEDADFVKAEEYYKLSTRKSTTNQYQKGLSYIKLADLNFNHLKNYVNAKLYYDSAALTLPKDHPKYDAITKKAQNLEYLTKRYQLIAEQDTLQLLAQMPEQARAKKLDEMFTPKIIPIVETKKANNGKLGREPNSSTQQNGKFYFSNSTAISKGFNDFKRRWGTRPLEENWRQSVKSSSQLNQQNQIAAIGNSADTSKNNLETEKADKIKAYTALLPLSADLMRKSDQQIIEAYFEIAGFYQQVLEDEPEAIKVYEMLLARYPQNNHLDAIYYSLYLGYSKTDQAKSNSYKNMVLAKFPGSVYAKTILDPNFSSKQNALDLEVNKLYNNVFAVYEKKEFPTVITNVNEVNQRFPGNSLQAQYDYLKSIAIGRTQNVDTLLTAFNNIIVQHPNDKLITPLVKDHIAYINANLASFKARRIALIDFDGTEPRFIAQQEPQKPAAKPEVIKEQPKVEQPKPTIVEPKPVIPPVEPKPVIAKTVTPPVKKDTVEKAIAKPDTIVETIKVDTVIAKLPVKIDTPVTVAKPADNFFSKAESNTYYYVIDVNDVTVSVSSSRFGVGQFNRGNFSGTGIKHQLLELAENQLIYVGDFSNLADVKAYAEGITPQLGRIMKVPALNYRGFYISKENFDKLKDREKLNRYIEFFRNNYQ
ncbi:MAG: gliding motility protein [Flavobacteriales bacterium]|nr:MAG: gliding motility protein [Flavobacteriales bacterium]